MPQPPVTFFRDSSSALPSPQAASGRDGYVRPLPCKTMPGSSGALEALLLRNGVALQELREDQANLRLLLRQQQAVLKEQHDVVIQKLHFMNGNGSGTPLIAFGDPSSKPMLAEEEKNAQETGDDGECVVQQETEINVIDGFYETHGQEPLSPTDPLGADFNDCENREVDESSLSFRMKRAILGFYFEAVMGFTIVINTVLMLVSLQMSGNHTAYRLGVGRDSEWLEMEERFEVAECCFVALYVVELVLRIWAAGWDFPNHLMNVADAWIVVISAIDSFVLPYLDVQDKINVSVLRCVRIFRLLRFMKFVRFAEQLGEMRILIHTMEVSLKGVIWSAIFLLGIVTMGSLLLLQLVANFLQDQSISLDRRIWLYNNFGTTTRVTYTMFECTFTGGWTLYSRPMIEEVSPAFAIYWIGYIMLVNFMTMRVIGAIFLKHALAVASRDEERAAMQKLKGRAHIAQQIRKIFARADVTGDGAINRAEFDEMIGDKQVMKYFLKIGLDEEEIIALFNVLSSDDGVVDYEEFLRGALKMKNSARTLDTIQMMHAQLIMSRKVEVL